MDERTHVPRELNKSLSSIRHVASGTYTRQPTSSAFSVPAESDRAEELWTPLPQDQWSDEFSPLYVSASGVFVEGDPSARDQTTPGEISRLVSDPTSGVTVDVPAVQNELLIQFTPIATPAAIRRILKCLDLTLISAWFEPDPSDPATSISWFHVRIASGARFHNDVPSAIKCLRTLPEVLHASYNDIVELCAGVYDAGRPGDPLFTKDTYDSYELLRLTGEEAAWNSENKVEFYAPADSVVSVVVMDTGVDVDHEDFIRVKIYDPKLGTLVAGGMDIAERNENTQIVTVGGERHGIAHIRGQPCWGTIRPWEPFNGKWGPDASAKAPPSSKSALKTLEFDKRSHGHGTVMAGVIAAAGGNETGTVGFGTKNVRVMSARMRMIGPKGVDIASAVKIVKCLRKRYGTTDAGQSAVRVVYMGFALDLPSRGSDTGDSKGMDDLLRCMRRDRKAGNDRVWIAPAHNRRSGNDPRDGGVLSYPAAILTDGASEAQNGRTTLAPGGKDCNPAVLGVTGVNATQEGAAVENSNYCVRVRRDNRTYFADRRVYGVSGAVSTGRPLVDVRDYYYRDGGRAGYRPPKKVVTDSAYDLAIDSGGYAETGDLPATGPDSRTYRLPTGNSIAAAQVAALAGILISKWTNNLNVSGNPQSESEADRVIWGIQQSVGTDYPGARKRVRIPGRVDFRSALERNLAVGPPGG